MIEAERKEDTRAASAAVLLLSFTLCLAGPAQIYFGNPLEFPFSLAEVSAPFLIRFTLSFLILAALVFALRGVPGYQRLVSLLLASGVMFYLQGNFCVWDYGPFNGRPIAWTEHLHRGIVEVVLWAPALSFSFFRPRVLLRATVRLSFFLIAVQLLALGVSAVRAKEAEFRQYSIAEDSKFVFSRSTNVIILTLDAFQSDIFQKIIAEEPAYKRRFPGFHYFRNALAGFPTSYPSVPLILTGRYYDNSTSLQEFIRSSFLSAASLPRILKEKGFQVELYPDRQCEVYCSEETASNCLRQEASAETIKAGVSALYEAAIFRYSPHFLKQVIFDGKPLWKGSKRLETSIGNRGTAEDLAFLAGMKSAADAGSEVSTFKYIHLWGLHPPYVINENMDYERLPQDRAGAEVHARGVLTLAGQFLEQLQRLGVYDNSLILIVSDHGLGSAVRLPAEMPASDVGQGVPPDIKGAALPLILVKPVGSKGDLAVVDSPVSLADIPKTVVSELRLDDGFPGISMFTPDLPALRERRFLSYSWRHAFFDADYLSPMQEYEVSGHSWLDQSWRATGREFRPPR